MGKLGGDSNLSARGKQYAKSLPLLIATHLGNSEQLTVSDLCLEVFITMKGRTDFFLLFLC